MSSLSFVSSSIVYYLVFKVQLISFETFHCCLESLDAVHGLSHLQCPAHLSAPCFSRNLLVGSSGLEPPTSRLSGVRSNHLSYEPISYPLRVVVEMNGIEPMTPCLQSRCSPSWATPPNISEDLSPFGYYQTFKIKQRSNQVSWADLGC